MFPVIVLLFDERFPDRVHHAVAIYDHAPAIIDIAPTRQCLGHTHAHMTGTYTRFRLQISLFLVVVQSRSSCICQNGYCQCYIQRNFQKKVYLGTSE